MKKAAGVIWIVLAMAVGTHAWGASDVSATPGQIQGVIHFNASFVPDSITVDARDSANKYTAQANATQGGPGCAVNSQDWCYSLTVESALANSYSIRPIAFVAKQNPFITNRIPFPPLDGVGIGSGQIVIGIDITYAPGEISGAVTAEDMLNVPLPIRSAYFSVFDNGNTFPESCGGSIEFCPFNSVFNAAPSSPVPPPAFNYQLYLKPGHDYTYMSQVANLDENAGTAHTVAVYNWTEHYGLAPAGGTNVNKPYDFHQVAAVMGNVSAPPGFSVYNLQVDATGTTTSGLGYTTSYITDNYYNPNPLASTNYVARIFSFADCTKPVSIRPTFTLSQSGTTTLTYPTQNAGVIPCGQTAVKDFGGTSATVAGNVIFDPPYPAGNIYPGIQAETIDLGVAQTTLVTNAAGGSYSMPVFGGDWQYWRWGWNFDLGNPNFTSTNFVSQFLNISVPVANGSTTNKDWKFDTALLKVFFTSPSAPPNTTISDPQLDADSGFLVNGVFTPDAEYDIAHAEGHNQIGVANGEVRMVLRVHNNTVFRVRPSAVINLGGAPGNGRTDFSPFYVTPHKGDVIIVGVPGSLSLVVNTPHEGQSLNTCVIPVSGSATGAPNITITVNGVVVPTASANDPNDPYRVTFSTTVSGGGATSITVKASAPNNTAVTDVIHVTATSASLNVSSSVGMSMMWPPNHDLVNVGLLAKATTACDANPTVAVQVFSNESDTEDTGSGNFSPDAKNVANGTLRLRSERKGNGDGRVFLIVSKGSDHFGNSGIDCTAVVVPHDQSASSVASILASANAAVASCKATGLAPAGYVQVGTGPIIGPKQ